MNYFRTGDGKVWTHSPLRGSRKRSDHTQWENSIGRSRDLCGEPLATSFTMTLRSDSFMLHCKALVLIKLCTITGKFHLQS